MADREQQLRHQAYKIVLWQGIVAFFASFLAWVLMGRAVSLSVFLGCSVALLSNFSFARTLFSVKGSGVAKKFVGAFFRAEIYKILVTVLLTLLAIKWGQVDFLPFIVGYTACCLVFWFAPLILQKKKAINP